MLWIGAFAAVALLAAGSIVAHVMVSDPVALDIATLPSVGSSASTSAPLMASGRSSDGTVGEAGGPSLVVEEGVNQFALPMPLTEEQWYATRARSDPADEDYLNRWVYRHGGADIGESARRVTVLGKTGSLVITGVRAEVLQRAAPLTGCLALVGAGIELEPIQAELNLDSDHPTAPYFVRTPVSVKRGESVVIDVYAKTTLSTVTWDLVIDLLVDGKKRPYRVSSEEGMLRTTADLRGDGDPLRFYRSTVGSIT